MTRNEILRLSIETQSGKSMFRQLIGQVTNLDLNLCIIQNDKLLHKAGEEIRQAMKELEPKQLEAMRQTAREADESELDEISEMYNREYMKFYNQKEVSEFLMADADIKWKTCTVDKRFVDNAKFTTDAIELLMEFTNIADMGSKEVKKGGKR